MPPPPSRKEGFITLVSGSLVWPSVPDPPAFSLQMLGYRHALPPLTTGFSRHACGEIQEITRNDHSGLLAEGSRVPGKHLKAAAKCHSCLSPKPDTDKGTKMCLPPSPARPSPECFLSPTSWTLGSQATSTCALEGNRADAEAGRASFGGAFHRALRRPSLVSASCSPLAATSCLTLRGNTAG